MSFRHFAFGQLNRLALYSFGILFTITLSACGGGGGVGELPQASTSGSVLEPEHSVPLTKHTRLSLREDEEFEVTFGLPLSSRISFSTRENPTFPRTKNVRTYFEIDIFPKTSFGVWKTDARAEGVDDLIDHVQGEEFGLTLRSSFQPSKNTSLLFYASSSIDEGTKEYPFFLKGFARSLLRGKFGLYFRIPF